MKRDRFSCLCKTQQLGCLPNHLGKIMKLVASHCEVAPEVIVTLVGRSRGASAAGEGEAIPQ